MNRVRMLGSVGVVLAMVLSAAFLTLPMKVEAQAVALEGVSFDVSKSLKDNLDSHIGKNIYINLRSGKTYQGIIKSVGKKFIHLEKMAGREFFDALINIEDISAVELQFRALK